MNGPVPYEDHIADGPIDDDHATEPECFVCGHEWPCPKTIAYNDGLNDGALNERARIVGMLHDLAREAKEKRYWDLVDAYERSAAAVAGTS